ncbi:uncharacterized protein METZ01_LOCUS373507, partial [marine metagenome]
VPEEYSNGELKQLDLLERIAKRSLKHQWPGKKHEIITQRDHWEKGNNEKLSDNELIYKAKYRTKINIDLCAR